MYTFLALLYFVSLASSHILPSIINGRDAKVGEFPWQASLQKFGRHSCGAVLVTTRWLITAAHCLGPIEGRTVVLGAHDIKTKVEGKPTTYEIEELIRNADWDDAIELGPGDIALIKLKEPAVIDKTYVDIVKPAPANIGNLVGANCTITGWGNTKVGSTGSPNILQAVPTTPLSKSDCQEGVDTITEYNITVTDEHICVGGAGPETGDACHGDSGGPLTCTLEDGSVIVAGVTSGGDDLCDPINPTLYTRISSFRKWLSDNSNGDVYGDL